MNQGNNIEITACVCGRYAICTHLIQNSTPQHNIDQLAISHPTENRTKNDDNNMEIEYYDHHLLKNDNKDEKDEPFKPYIKITVQPSSNSSKFRYDSEIKEDRSPGIITGVNSTADHITYPTIKLVGFKGKAVLIVSCVTKDKQFRPHPHKLWEQKSRVVHGVCCIEVDERESIEESMKKSKPTSEPKQINKSMTFAFKVGVICAKHNDVVSFEEREKINIDPFETGFSHKNNLKSIDYKAVRFGIQAFLFCEETNKYCFKTKPVVSDIIYNKDIMPDLVICRLSLASASAEGGEEMILLCKNLKTDENHSDIKVRFFEEDEKCQRTWQSDAKLVVSSAIHEQVAITFTTPEYKTRKIADPVDVKIELERCLDEKLSVARNFKFIPAVKGGRKTTAPKFEDDIILKPRKPKKRKADPDAPSYSKESGPSTSFKNSCDSPDTASTLSYKELEDKEIKMLTKLLNDLKTVSK